MATIADAAKLPAAMRIPGERRPFSFSQPMAHTTRDIRKVMQMNQCPDCGRTAMNFAAKLVGTSLSCQHCQAKLRLRLAPTAGLAILVLVAILFAGMNFGVNGASVLFAVCCLVAFLAACLLMPLEVINKDQES